MTNEELLKIIQQAARDRVTQLDISEKGLTSLPSEIGRLTYLRELNLSRNQLTRLPIEIGRLTNLSKLDLNGNQLKSLPSEIGQLIELNELDLYGNQLIKLPAEIGLLINLSVLDLSGNQLTNLLSEIGHLANLNTLVLSGNRLANLPTEIGKLNNLSMLTLSFNQLESLPAEIERLTSLSMLDLRNNRLTNLLVEVGRLTNLKMLDISFNRLDSLPAEIGQLNNLSTFTLSRNQLKNLPREVGKLTNLETLTLRDNQLMSLPGEIGKLINLNTLTLRDNQLMSLPEEIRQLINLTMLDLSGNQLLKVPTEIGQLTSLNTLFLNNNQLTTLPTEIVQLTNLRKLNLSSNQLINLPVEIVQLTNLCELDLSRNQLMTLPKEIIQLTKLNTLYLEGNPLSSLQPEIRKQAAREILNFYRQQIEQDTDHLYEAKLLIVGEAGAGKTTLARKIQDPDYLLQEDEASTEGIDVIRWYFPLDNGKDFCINIWDFGGQEIYHATHQFFLTKRSLYVLVADTRKEDTDFYYWLNVVELLSDNSPLLIIKNEKQERKKEINERQLRGQFTNLKETLATDLATKRGLSEILTKIKHYIRNLPHIGTELPKTWVNVREALEEESRNYISLEEYLQVCQDKGFTKLEDKLQLSGYLHDLGVCLHFQEDDLLMKTVILKPIWGTDAVYKVLDNSRVIQNLGKFTRTDLATIWHENKYAPMKVELLRLMMNFKLCYEIPCDPGIYIAPQLLSPDQPDYAWDESENLLLRYEYEFMPKGILTRFIVEMHKWIENQVRVWKTGVVLSKDQARAEVIEYYHLREIRIRVAGNRKRDLLTTIRHEIDKIHDSYKSVDDQQNRVQRLKYSTLVPCNCVVCKRNKSPHFYPLEWLHKFLDDRKDIQCPNSYDMINVWRLLDDVASETSLLKVGAWNDRTINLYGGDYIEGNKAAQDLIGGDKVGGDKTVNDDDSCS